MFCVVYNNIQKFTIITLLTTIIIITAKFYNWFIYHNGTALLYICTYVCSHKCIKLQVCSYTLPTQLECVNSILHWPCMLWDNISYIRSRVDNQCVHMFIASAKLIMPKTTCSLSVAAPSNIRQCSVI